MIDRSVLPDKETLVAAATHVVFTGVIGDKLGNILNSYTYVERQYIVGDWVKKNKGEYPTIKGAKHKRHAYNSKILLALLELLGDTNPLRSEEDFSEFTKHYGDLANEYIGADLEHNLLLALGVGVGMYSGLLSLRPRFNLFDLDRLIEVVYAPIAESNSFQFMTQNMSALRTVVYVFQRLLVEGYFGVEVIQTCIDRGYCKGTFAEVLDTYNHYAKSPEFFANATPCDKQFNGLTYYERMVAVSLYYLYKIDLCTKGVKKPRFLVEDVVAVEKVGMHDLLFLFSTLCVSSEHHYLLFVKPLHDQLNKKAELEDAVKSIVA